MSQFYSTYRSNYFKVKDQDRLYEIVEEMAGAEVFQGDDEYLAFGDIESPSGFTYMDDDGEDIDLYEEIQKILDKDQVCVVNEIGNEKLRYVVAGTTIVTNDEIDFINHFGHVKELIEPITKYKKNLEFDN